MQFNLTHGKEGDLVNEQVLNAADHASEENGAPSLSSSLTLGKHASLPWYHH